MYKLGLLNRIKKNLFFKYSKNMNSLNSLYLIFEDLVLIYSDLVTFFLLLKKLNFLFFFSNKLLFKKTYFKSLFNFNKYFIINLSVMQLFSNFNLLQYLSFNNTLNYINSTSKKYKKIDIFNIRLKFLYVIYSNILITNGYFFKFVNFVLFYYNLLVLNYFVLYFINKLNFIFIKNVYFKSNY